MTCAPASSIRWRNRATPCMHALHMCMRNGRPGVRGQARACIAAVLQWLWRQSMAKAALLGAYCWSQSCFLTGSASVARGRGDRRSSASNQQVFRWRSLPPRPCRRHRRGLIGSGSGGDARGSCCQGAAVRYSRVTAAACQRGRDWRRVTRLVNVLRLGRAPCPCLVTTMHIAGNAAAAAHLGGTTTSGLTRALHARCG